MKNVALFGLVCVVLGLLALFAPVFPGGSNFLHVLQIGLSGTTDTQPNPIAPQGTASPPIQQPKHSQAWEDGYAWGQEYGQLDRNTSSTSFMYPDSEKKQDIAKRSGYEFGSVQYGDFWEGYSKGYLAAR